MERASLVAWWLRIHLPMQGTWIPSLIRERRTHMLWNNQPQEPYLLRLCSKAWELKPLKPKSLCSAAREAPTVRSLCTATRKPACRQK